MAATILETAAGGWEVDLDYTPKDYSRLMDAWRDLIGELDRRGHPAHDAPGRAEP
jgi:hypothetical protein